MLSLSVKFSLFIACVQQTYPTLFPLYNWVSVKVFMSGKELCVIGKFANIIKYEVLSSLCYYFFLRSF